MAISQTLAFLFSVFCVFLCVSNIVTVSGQLTSFTRYQLPQNVTTESIAFRTTLLFSDGPYVATSDGRILRLQGSGIGFQDFAYTSPDRTKQLCDGTENLDLGPVCGTPLALSFQPLTGICYIADAYRGLEAVGPNGGRATILVGGFKFPSGVDVDLLTGFVYFQEASIAFEFRDTRRPGFQANSTGRFSHYNPLTRQVTVLLSGLSGGGSPAVSRDGTYHYKKIAF